MQILRISGGRQLRGEIAIPGSKNAALAILSAVPLIDKPITLHGVPDISDVRIKVDLLRDFGAEIERIDGVLHIDPSSIRYHEPSAESVQAIRTSFCLLGPLLARLGRAYLPVPGGCRIGLRPVDFHLKGLAILGADVRLDNGVYVASTAGLTGAEIYLDFPSAGATHHLMSAAILAKGQTVISNVAVEPEVISLAQFLNSLGARIEGAGTSTLTIQGVTALSGGEFRIPADRLQASTYLMAGAITCGDVTVRGVLPEQQVATVNKLREAGAQSDEGPDWVRVWATDRLHGIKVKTMPYPGFPTDIQQPMAALLATARKGSVVEETVYESRIGHISELNRMGAKMTIEGRATLIEGVDRLKGTVVTASDLRAGAALVLAAMAASGESIIKNVHYIDRGYDGFEGRLRSLGADIERVDLADWERDRSGRIQSAE